MRIQEIEDQAKAFVDYFAKFRGVEIYVYVIFEKWVNSKGFCDENERKIWIKAQEIIESD